MNKRQLVIAVLGLVVTATTLAVTAALAGDGALPQELRAVRSAVARYHSFEQATKARRLPAHTPLGPGDSLPVR